MGKWNAFTGTCNCRVQRNLFLIGRIGFFAVNYRFNSFNRDVVKFYAVVADNELQYRNGKGREYDRK